ncbi:MAG: ABC transporter ATP-binding protein [Chloroflexota bacterium]
MAAASDKKANSVPIWPLVRRIMGTAGRDQILFYAATLAVLIQAGLFLVFNQSMRQLVDAAMARQVARFFRYLWLVAGSLFVLAPVAAAQSYFGGAFSERTLARVRQRLAERLASLPVAVFQSRHTGDLMSVMSNDVNTLKTLTATDLTEIINQVVSAVAALVFLALMSWQLTVAAVIAVPLMAVIMNRVIAPIAARAAELQDEVGKVTSIAQDGLAGLTVTRAFGLEAKLDERLRTANRVVLQQAGRVVRLRAISNALSNGLPILPFLITFGYGGYLAISGQMTAGSLIAFVNLLNNISNPMASLPRLYSNLAVAAGGAARVFDLLDQPAERTDGQVMAANPDADSVVRFADVSFGYVPEAKVFTGVNLAVRPGERVAVVGPSGGGKSTLLRLLLGFYEPDAGSVQLYGRDLREWRLSAARDQMSLVAQDTYLFPVSIADNIAYGRPGASHDEIERAARLANIHDFIAGLPDGYRTIVGERGARLSGGQRQRIAIARAILKDAPLLLLDEATSALDTESEALVQEALERFMVGRTTIVIAHRLSTIKNADRVVVLDQGRIVETGTHEQLLAAGGLYQRLYLKQFAGQNGDAAVSVAGGAQA